ncbi:hypothetical protein PVIIG_05291 [Plasmodium vivax India VII]|uniref:Uncharacterized protein n=3 Tax=Plasmodium vivax TaxID=5855 RepID=A0A0J9W430_PLAVI|nr:hypothetical protein PVIIG_05291 [Plasmodium vivax India VII]KMZ95103.1 hypothetical protein PVMG_05975 [Plasmodium vivax Mauritania I]KMZ98405.1 hypothetical protein PVNG_04349 [Plasmodium vivax North Korean]
MAKIICNKLISIYKKLKNKSSNYSRDINYKKDFAFLTYWVNWKIYGEFYEKISVSEFYDLIGSYVQLDSGYELTNTHVFEIDKDVLNKLNILYNLYKNYSKLNSIKYTNSEQNNEVLTLSTACCTDYIKVSYICNGDNKKNNHKFCKKLNVFESKYNGLFNKYDKNIYEFSDNLIKLEECPNPKIITTAITGSIIGLIPLVGILYKASELNIKL